MKFPLCITVLFAILFLPAVVQAEFYVIGTGGRIVGTEIKSLPYTISSSGFYYITKDLACPSGSHGITISANDVTLDLMGFSLVGPGGSEIDSGIYIYESNYAEVRNGVINNFHSHGIYQGSGSGHRIINIRAHHNGEMGICLTGAATTVQGCVCSSNYMFGIDVSDGSLVLNNTAYDNGRGGIYAGSGSFVMGNICGSNNEHGIQTGYGVSIVSNSIYGTEGSGITTGDDCLIKGNTFQYNSGADIIPGNYSLIVQNVADNYPGGIKECPTNSTCRYLDNIPEWPIP